MKEKWRLFHSPAPQAKENGAEDKGTRGQGWLRGSRRDRVKQAGSSRPVTVTSSSLSPASALIAFALGAVNLHVQNDSSKHTAPQGKGCFRGINLLPKVIPRQASPTLHLVKDGLKWGQRPRDESGEEMDFQANQERTILMSNLPAVTRCAYLPLSVALYLHDVCRRSTRTVRQETGDWLGESS